MSNIRFPCDEKDVYVTVDTTGLTADEIKYLQEQRTKRVAAFGEKSMDAVLKEVRQLLADLPHKFRLLFLLGPSEPGELNIVGYSLSVGDEEAFGFEIIN